MSTHSALSSSNKQLTIITFIVFVGFIGVALPFPIFAPMFLTPTASGIISVDSSQFCRGLYLGITLAVYPFGQFIGSPLLGAYSDHYGRKKVLLVCLLGTALGYVFTAFAIYRNNLLLLILSRFFTGFLEGNVAIARAMAAALPGHYRHKSFGLIGVATSLGYIFGPAIGGLLADNHFSTWFNYRVPFYLAACLSLFAYTITYVALSESQSNDDELRVLNKNEGVKQFKIMLTHPLMLISFLTLFLLSLAVDTYYEFFPAYLTGVWKATPASIGFFTICLAIAVTFGDFFLVPYMERFKNDLKTIFYFSVMLAILIFCITLSNNYYSLYVIFILVGLAVPAATTTMVIYLSHLSKTNQLGSTMGLATSARALGDSITCVIGGMIVGFSYNLPLYLSVVFTILSIIFICYLSNRAKLLKHMC